MVSILNSIALKLRQVYFFLKELFLEITSELREVEEEQTE